MNRYDGGHVRRVGVVVFPPHGVEEHFFRRVDPVPGFGVRARLLFVVGDWRGTGVGRCGREGRVGAGDGTDFAVGG